MLLFPRKQHDQFFEIIQRRGDTLVLSSYVVERWEDESEDADFASDEKYFMERYASIDWTYELPWDHDLEEKGIDQIPFPAPLNGEQMEAFEKNTGITRNQLFIICMMLALAKLTGKQDIMLMYTFHSRMDQVTAEAMGALYILLPMAIRLGSYRNLAELYDDVKAQSIGNVHHHNHNWMDLIVPGELHHVIGISYETNQITDSTAAFKKIGIEEVPFGNGDKMITPSPMLSMLFDTGEAFTLMIGYQTNYYKQETVNRFAQCNNAFITALTSVNNPAEISISDLMEDIGS